ncbi:response regulator transcription factor [Aggregatilinea lenta]|uniref:response regulator transcription factor n=1 Tax=Aggregatilinea lenta TaxID=913108 RepID=UPI000E5B7122|nr:response regulator [Aggregatilinea lenta]
MSEGDPIRPASPPTPPAPQPSTSPAVLSALVIDDEPANCDFCVRLLQQAKLNVKGASTGQEALDLAVTTENLALIVIDHRLPDMSGVSLLAKLRALFPDAMLCMATMHDERSLMEQAFALGCDVFLVKPHGFMELFKRLKATPPGGPDTHDQLIIDQYGLRPYRG